MVFAGILFGWKYALYSMVTIFVSSRVTDAILMMREGLIITKRKQYYWRLLRVKSILTSSII